MTFGGRSYPNHSYLRESRYEASDFTCSMKPSVGEFANPCRNESQRFKKRLIS